MKTIYLVASGDLRLSANQSCWAAQEAMEKQVVAAVEREGWKVKRAHPYNPQEGHGFIDSQRRGIEIFRSIPPTALLIVAEAVWQYSHHVLPGLTTHRGPILTLANWSGQWPGLVGMLNLNGSLSKAGVKYSTLWSENFDDEFFIKGLRQWLKTGKIKHNASHVRPYQNVKVPAGAAKIGAKFAKEFRANKSIIGVFDEGCMGMYNAIIPDEILNPVGVFKERLSQSALYAKMRTVSDAEARAVYEWLLKKGMKFNLGKDEKTELTESQVLTQCKMYVAAVRIADEFGCDGIGIQYQQGLKDVTPASDLVEGILNNVDRPPVSHESNGKILFPDQALPHFNEVDECAGLDALITNRLWNILGFAPETTLHDVRWGRTIGDRFVWILEISGAVPPAHFANGYADATGERQPAMYFPLGGSTIKGLSKPGWVVWSRVFVADNRLHCDIGLGEAVTVSPQIAEENWKQTTSQWPIMHFVMRGITRDQFMARHKANHIQVVYAPSEADARKALFAKAAAMDERTWHSCFVVRKNLAMSKFAIGLDFGTESGRALVVEVATGRIAGSAAHRYADGVIDDRLPGTTTQLEPDTALQNPNDYVETLKRAVPEALKQAGACAEDVIGIGVDFTACTVLPTLDDGRPLCNVPQWRTNPHSWVKLWKHHAAQPEADKINEVARERGESWLPIYGGIVSSEWAHSKTLQILNDAPDVYDATEKIVEGAIGSCGR